MALAAGQKLGSYEIVSPLGAGGMGEVYRARDTRLGREVAIKVLPQHLSSNPDLKARFEREAKAISALSHPHICHLYDVGSQSGTDYLVMELLEGDSLNKRVERRPLSLKQALEIGVQIAEALEKAHKSGIVHRDLKPGNIVLTQEGAKLLDFGLAKPSVAAIGAVSSAASGKLTPSTPTMSVAALASPAGGLTQQGTIVGTFQYMAPECLQGQEADARSDLFSFGCVLYEMVTGRRAFEGKSQLSVLTAILEKDPEPVSKVQPAAPTALEHVIQRALAKDPTERWQGAADLKAELKWIAVSMSQGQATAAVTALEKPMRKTERLVWIAAVFGAVAVSVLGTMLYRPLPTPPPIRTVINPPEKAMLDLTGDGAGPPVLSPDGRWLAFAATGQDGKISLWVRPMNSLEARALSDTDGVEFPFWSPDGRSVGFFADGKLKTIDPNGGSALVICDAQNGRGGTWSLNGTILFSGNVDSPIIQVSASGGTPVAVTKVDTALHTSHRWPFLLPDGKHFLYLAIHHDAAKSANNGVYYASVDGGEGRLLLHAQSNAIYAAGNLLFMRGNQLLAQAFNPAQGKLKGEPQVVADGVMNDASTWHMVASAADNGLLVFGTGVSADLQLVWLDRASKQVTPIADKLTNLQLARISPRGDRVALQIDSGANDVWVLDLARGVRTRLTFGPVQNLFPAWSPDGKWLAYASTRDSRFGIYRKPANGSGAEEMLFVSDAKQLEPDSWSRDGRYLFYTERAAGGMGRPRADLAGEVWALPLTGERKPQMLVQQGSQGNLSPDGRWLAYSSKESGTPEVYVVAFGGGQGKWQVSSAGGSLPHWSRDGKELFYLSNNYSLLVAPVKESGGALQFGAATAVVTNWTAPQYFYDLSPDDKKVLLDRVPQQVGQSVSVISNFRGELKK
jgi:eukaryotic-like serine/threonine-protein kinase